MQNLEQLQRLADNAGFQTEFDIDGNPFDVCVASIATGTDNRFAAFNVQDGQSLHGFERNANRLRQAALMLSDKGLMFVYGRPAVPAPYAVPLSKMWSFGYGIPVRGGSHSQTASL